MTTDKYCDCAQGRWPCTCMPRYSIEQQKLSNNFDDATRARELRASAEWIKEIGKQQRVSGEGLRHLRKGGRVSFADGKEALLPPDAVGPTIVDLIQQGYLSPYDAKINRPGYWERLATDKKKQLALKCTEFDALSARLQIYRAVALIGWAGFILTLLGV